MLEWAHTTSDGSRSSMSFVPDAKLWNAVAAEADYCLKSKCSFFNECYINKVRREANSAHILIVNHHILMSDIVLRYAEKDYKMYGVLPAYRRIIFDEAHNLEDVAVKHLGISLSFAGLLRSLNKLFSVSAGKERGALAYTLNSILQCGDIENKRDLADIFREKIFREIHSLKAELEIAFETMKFYFFSTLDRNASNSPIFFKIRLTPNVLSMSGFYENCESDKAI